MLAKLSHVITEIGIGEVARVGRDNLGAQPDGHRGTQLVTRDIRLGLEDEIVVHARLGASGRIIGPLARQTERICEWQAGVTIGRRPAARDLVVIASADVVPSTQPANQKSLPTA